MDVSIASVFEMISIDEDASFDFSFHTEKDLDNIQAMYVFLEENGLEEYVSEDDGTLVFLEHEAYDFEVAVRSSGLGDFFSHGIYMVKADE